jgi:hypothetical protein
MLWGWSARRETGATAVNRHAVVVTHVNKEPAAASGTAIAFLRQSGKMALMEERVTTPSIWSEVRQPRPGPTQHEETAANPSAPPPEGEPGSGGYRSVFQQDYDRLLFSSPVRRLADKTQVWPMDENDGVRTRLTHSHEVANLTRSIGTRAFKDAREHFKDQNGEVSLGETIQPMAAGYRACA